MPDAKIGKKKTTTKRRRPAPVVQVLPRTSTILSDLITALAYEASRLASLAQSGKLDSKDRMALEGFSRALPNLTKEEDRLAKKDAVDSLSDDQLKELAAKLLLEHRE